MRKLLVAVVLVLSPLAPVRAQYCPGVAPWVFVDVPASHAFCNYVTWMAQRNVTTGCLIIDANNREYCPDDYVTRFQMAAFMSRLGDALFPSTCAAGQVMKWNGLAWACADDSLGGGGGGGTVTSVAASTGLAAAPNPIVGAGTLSVAPSYRLPQGCAANQVAKWIGGAWTCAADNDTNSGGTVTSLTQGSGIVLAPNPIVAVGTISADTAYLQRRVFQSCIAGASIRAIAADGTVTCEVDSGTFAFTQGGDAFGATAVLGTTDNNALDVRVNNSRVMRYEPNAISPNVIGGHSGNRADPGVRGATIGGGGAATGSDPDLPLEAPNRITDHFGTVAGGYDNQAGDAAGSASDRAFATVGGGRNNTASGEASTIGGGDENSAIAEASTVCGGDSNYASGRRSTIGGGFDNVASGQYSTVLGGDDNVADGGYSTVVGGGDNRASGNYSIAGGYFSDASGNHSIAIGRRAKAFNGANIGHGAIVIADGNDFDFNIGTDNRFGVRATGGVYLALGIDGTGAATWTCQASNGNAWACASDRNLKHGLVELDARAVLDKVAALPVYQWQPKGPNAHVLHYGPMAQDFHAAFGLGDDDRMIGMQDADGVALAAIKGLNAKVDEQAREIAELRALVKRLAAAR